MCEYGIKHQSLNKVCYFSNAIYANLPVAFIYFDHQKIVVYLKPVCIIYIKYILSQNAY